MSTSAIRSSAVTWETAGGGQTLHLAHPTYVPRPRSPSGCGHHVLVSGTGRWRGVVIAEGLNDPALINDLQVTKAFITGDDQPLDEDGTQGRWHLYWVDVSDDQIDLIQATTRYAWYAHFWLRTTGCLWSITMHASTCTVTTSRPGRLRLTTDWSKASAASGWTSQPTTRWAHSYDYSNGLK